MTDQAQNHRCFICAGADDDEGFDECEACRRKAIPLPPGARGTGGSVMLAPASRSDPATGLDHAKRANESDLMRAIRLARGIPDPEDVPGSLQALFGKAKP